MRLSFILLLTFSFKCLAFTILIDPGHGGEEEGAVNTVMLSGKKVVLKEKDLALRLAKKVKVYLGQKHSVYLTRSFDRKVTLQERANIADQIKADIFVSLHLNAHPNKKYHGFEVYYLDNKKGKAVAKVARVENGELSGEELIINQILIDLVISKTTTDSKKLAKLIHRQIKSKMKKKYRLRDRGIKSDLFYVLALSKRPSAFIEMGFISNELEAKKMNQEKFLNDYAKAISSGITNYFKGLNKRTLPLF